MSKIRNAMASAVAGAAMLAASAAPTVSAEMKPSLSLDAANAMVQACLTLAAAEGWAMHVTVLDDGANLKAYARMDNHAAGPGYFHEQGPDLGDVPRTDEHDGPDGVR